MSGHKSTKKGSNIICRVSNVTPEMVCCYVKRMPKQKMKEESFRDIMGKSWFQNEHQAPEQWGLYYIDGTLSGKWYLSDNTLPIKFETFEDEEGHNAVRIKWTATMSG